MTIARRRRLGCTAQVARTAARCSTMARTTEQVVLLERRRDRSHGEERSHVRDCFPFHISHAGFHLPYCPSHLHREKRAHGEDITHDDGDRFWLPSVISFLSFVRDSHSFNLPDI
jgi:choline dehydrogenase-like flavoprotein